MAQCPDCNAVAIFSIPTRGNGKCSRCHGDGKRLLSGLNEAMCDTPLYCENCGGSGDCPTCDGTGEIDTDLGFNEYDVPEARPALISESTSAFSGTSATLLEDDEDDSSSQDSSESDSDDDSSSYSSPSFPLLPIIPITGQASNATEFLAAPATPEIPAVQKVPISNLFGYILIILLILDLLIPDPLPFLDEGILFFAVMKYLKSKRIWFSDFS